MTIFFTTFSSSKHTTGIAIPQSFLYRHSSQLPCSAICSVLLPPSPKDAGTKQESVCQLYHPLVNILTLSPVWRESIHDLAWMDRSESMWHFKINSEHWAYAQNGFILQMKPPTAQIIVVAVCWKLQEYSRGKYSSVFALSLPSFLNCCRVSGYCQKQNAQPAGSLVWLVVICWQLFLI